MRTATFLYLVERLLGGDDQQNRFFDKTFEFSLNDHPVRRQQKEMKCFR